MSEKVTDQGATLERKALAALRKMRQKLDEIEQARTEPIAIVGAGCRLPGGASDPEAFWDLLRNGVDAIREVPDNRWKIEDYFDPNPGTPGKTYSRWGGFMDHIDRFDSEFFGISPREAVHMDPQQRVFLEVAWEALENAGIAPDRLKGSSAGVFVGTTMSDYLLEHLRHGKPSDLDAYILSGNTMNGISGRLAYFLGTHGPSISMDTACSSSLVAVDRACRSLREGECTLAIAGGVNLILAPDLFVCMSKWGMLSPDGRCKTFDASANGFVRAEGCGIVVLKCLGAALAEGDRILALIRGSAVNQDGPSSGLSVPNGLAQEAVIRQVLQNARLEPSDLSYIEAHGTGTTLGDPIEIDALARVFGPGRNAEVPVILGSVKTNLGHLEAASGITGLLKVVLMLGHTQIPPHLHFTQPSPHIPWEKYPFLVSTRLIDWEPVNGKRIAGVSSFGFSGSNAHVILEEAPAAAKPPNWVERPLQLLTLSARDEAALRSLTASIEAQLKREPQLSLPDFCFTANVGRSHFDHRLSVLSSTNEEAREKLRAFLAGETRAGLTTSRVFGNQPKIALLFTGQGAQHVGMGLRLYETSPTFRKVLNRCDTLLRPHVDQPLLSLLYSQTKQVPLLDRTIYTQPAMFALEYALYALWSSWGVQPSFVMGHSLGEYVAACAAGVFSLEDGLKLVAERARLIQAEPPDGRMASVGAGEEEVRAAIEPFTSTVSIAAINGPRNVVISGAAVDLEAVIRRLAAAGAQTRILNVSHAFHSPLMEPMLATFENAVANISLQKPTVRLISNLTGRVAKAEEIVRPEYWRKHLREPVRFAAGVQTLTESGCDIFLELGPSPVLLAMGRQCTPNSDALWLPTLRPGRDDWSESLASLQALHHAGVSLNWKGFDSDYPRHKLQLPTYPFQRERFWFDLAPRAPNDGPDHQFSHRPGTHPLLGAALRSPALKETVFQSQLSAQNPAFLADHQICGHVILPAAAYVEMALEGGHRLFGGGVHRVENLWLQDTLRLDLTVQTSIQVIFQAKDRDSAVFEMFSAPGDGQEADAVWSRHALGRVVQGKEPDATDDKAADLLAARNRCSERLNTAALYKKLNEQGAQFGPAFRNVHALWRGTTETLAEIVLANSSISEAALYRFHPALLDACFQAAAQALPDRADRATKDEILLPVNIEDVQIWRDIPTAFWSHGWLRGTPDPEAHTFTLDLKIYDPEGQALGKIAGLHLKRVSRRSLDWAVQEAEQNWLFEIRWREASRPEVITREHAEPIDQPGTWLILADEKGVGESLRTRLASAGQNCVVARPGPSFARQSDDQFALDPANGVDYERLLEEARITAQTPLRGVLHLWSLDFTNIDTMMSEDLAHSQLLGCGAALHLVQALCSLKTNAPPSLCLVTEGAYAASELSTPVHPAMTSLCGLGQVITAEHPELRCRLLDLDRQRTEDAGNTIFEELARGDFGENAIAFRDQSRLVPRLVGLTSVTATGPSPDKICNPLQLEAAQAGILDDLQWAPVERVAPGPGEVEIRVQATGLNFRDVLCSLGMYPGRTGALGAECSGIITRVGDGVSEREPGDEVMAVARGGFNTFVRVRADHVSSLPIGVSLTEAASIPVAFLTSYYGLHRLARIKDGDRVLIHAAAGGVGLAAVQLAQRAGAEIYATAGSAEKQRHLRALGVSQVFDSRSIGFAKEIMSRTGNRGVDIVLNSLAGEFIAKSLSVLAPGGRFLELGKRGILTKEQFAVARPDCEYFAFDLGEEALGDPSLLPAMFHDLLAAFAKRELRLLPVRTFSNERVADAFRFMAQAKHIGKIIIAKPSVETARSSPNALPLRDNATYLITGGLGGLGLETARWMTGKGARNIVLMGRHAADSKTKAVVNAMQQDGARITIEKCDVSDEAALALSLERMAKSMPPLRGIVHAAGVLDDGILEQQSWSRFVGVMAPKAGGSWNLHRLTLSQDLDFFVLFSAAASLIGSSGQGSYAAANAFMDGLAHFRKAQGRSALSINWGAWSKVGMAARLSEKDRERWIDRGVRPIDLDEGMAKLGEMLVSEQAQVVAAPIDWSRMFTAAVGSRVPSLFLELVSPTGAFVVLEEETRAEGDGFVLRLSAEPVGRRLAILTSHVESAASRALGATDSKTLDPRRPLHELGLDSLMSVELRNSLATSLGRPLPATLLFDYPTVESLTHYLAKNFLNLETLNEGAPIESEDSDEKNVKELREMSEKEAEALLLAELDQLKK